MVLSLCGVLGSFLSFFSSFFSGAEAYLDLCTWELLKVPAISPLPLESVLGEIKSGCAFIYDLGRWAKMGVGHHPGRLARQGIASVGSIEST